MENKEKIQEIILKIKTIKDDTVIQDMQPADVWGQYFNNVINLDFCDGCYENPNEHYPDLINAITEDEKIYNMLVMDAAMRWSNDERISERWLTYGIPDGYSFEEITYDIQTDFYNDFCNAYKRIVEDVRKEIEHEEDIER